MKNQMIAVFFCLSAVAGCSGNKAEHTVNFVDRNGNTRTGNFSSQHDCEAAITLIQASGAQSVGVCEQVFKVKD